MAKTNVTEKATHKQHEITDKINDSITYNWDKRINRVTENNNALIKCSPTFLCEVQKKNSDLTSDRKIKQYICLKLDIPWSEEFMHFSLAQMVPKKAVPDKTEGLTDKKIIDAFGKMIEKESVRTKKPLTNEQITNSINSSKLGDFHKEMLKKHFLTEKNVGKSDSEQIEDLGFSF